MSRFNAAMLIIGFTALLGEADPREWRFPLSSSFRVTEDIDVELVPEYRIEAGEYSSGLFEVGIVYDLPDKWELESALRGEKEVEEDGDRKSRLRITSSVNKEVKVFNRKQDLRLRWIAGREFGDEGSGSDLGLRWKSKLKIIPILDAIWYEAYYDLADRRYRKYRLGAESEYELNKSSEISLEYAFQQSMTDRERKHIFDLKYSVEFDLRRK